MTTEYCEQLRKFPRLSFLVPYILIDGKPYSPCNKLGQQKIHYVPLRYARHLVWEHYQPYRVTNARLSPFYITQNTLRSDKARQAYLDITKRNLGCKSDVSLMNLTFNKEV